MSEKRPPSSHSKNVDQPKVKRSRFSGSGNQPNGSETANAPDLQNGPVTTDAKDKLKKPGLDVVARKAELKAQLEALKARASANKATQAAAAARPAVPAATERRLGDQPQAAQQAAPAGRLPPPASAPPAPSAKPEEPQASYYDPFLNDKSGKRLNRRHRPGFDFVKAGVFQKEAEQQRLKAALGEDAFKKQARLKAEDRRQAAENAVADANLIPLGQRAAPREPEKPTLEPIPEVEWWDLPVLANAGSYDGEEHEGYLNEGKITHYVEHPVPLEPPAEEAPPPPMPLPLTQKERKKLRTQRRVEKEKEKQELQRQGLLEPAKPKLKLSTFYRSLGAEASADPTAVEREVRQAQEARVQAHEDRNLANKLTPAERRDKKIEKIVGAAKEGEATPVSVYKVTNLESGKHRFKVKANAEEFHMTGRAVITDAASIIIVEGGHKSQKKYAHVLLNRIKWNDTDEVEEEDESPRPHNECVRVWAGSIKKPVFENFALEVCRTEAAARKFLGDKGLQHYWDLAMADKADE